MVEAISVVMCTHEGCGSVTFRVSTTPRVIFCDVCGSKYEYSLVLKKLYRQAKQKEVDGDRLNATEEEQDELNENDDEEYPFT